MLTWFIVNIVLSVLALVAIAAASGGNIFQDGDTVVVDYCDE